MDTKSTGADIMITSSNSLTPGSPQPSVPDAVRAFLTNLGLESSVDLEMTTACLALLVGTLSFNMLSGDAWYLSLMGMKRRAMDLEPVRASMIPLRKKLSA